MAKLTIITKAMNYKAYEYHKSLEVDPIHWLILSKLTQSVTLRVL